jgi:hypothetical protein
MYQNVGYALDRLGQSCTSPMESIGKLGALWVVFFPWIMDVTNNNKLHKNHR